MFIPFIMLSAQAISAATPPVVVQSVVAPLAKPKLICETEDAIGSRLGGKRVCMTREDWVQSRNTDRASLEGRQRQTNVGKPVR